MNVSVRADAPTRFATPLLAVPVAADADPGALPGLDGAAAAQLAAAHGRGDFAGKEGQTLLLYPGERGGPGRV
ncbi:MAG TPA: hypothetical protein VGR37_01295, partial [Longimicrobiaceae bacterium]|nr:hypothetical protein [Longimicrobiaceae bacterium]